MMNPQIEVTLGFIKIIWGAQTITEGIDKCTALQLNTCVHTLSPQKTEKIYPKEKNTCERNCSAFR